MTLHLSQAERADTPALAAILSDWIDETAWMPRLHTRAEDRGFLEHLILTAEVTVARRNGLIMGFLARKGREIPALYLAATARRQGVGAALVADAKTRVPELTLWTFQANLSARAFYVNAGFREILLTDGAANDEKLPDVRLIWQETIGEMRPASDYRPKTGDHP